MVKFIKPPFFQWPVKPVAGRGLSSTVSPPPPPPVNVLALRAGQPGFSGNFQVFGSFNYTLPLTYVPGQPITVRLDMKLTVADPLARIGCVATTIDDDVVTNAAYSATLGIAPGQECVLYVRQGADPAAMTFAQFDALNGYNVAGLTPTIVRAIQNYALPGDNLDTGITCCLDWFSGSPAFPNPAVGQNINGGVILEDGANVSALSGGVIPPQTPGESWSPTLVPTPGEYGFLQTLNIAQMLSGGTGATGIPGFPGLDAVPAGSKQLAAGASLTIGMNAISPSGGTLNIYAITVIAAGVPTVINLNNVYRFNLYNSASILPPEFVNGVANGSTFWTALVPP